jgi:hypothetical protein
MKWTHWSGQGRLRGLLSKYLGYPGVPWIGKDVTSIESGRFANVFSNPWDTWVVNSIFEDSEQSVGDSECGVDASDDRTSRLDPDNRSPESVSALFPRPDGVGFPNRRKRIFSIRVLISDESSRFVLRSHLSIQTAPTFRMSEYCRELLIVCRLCVENWLSLRLPSVVISPERCQNFGQRRASDFALSAKSGVKNIGQNIASRFCENSVGLWLFCFQIRPNYKAFFWLNLLIFTGYTSVEPSKRKNRIKNINGRQNYPLLIISQPSIHSPFKSPVIHSIHQKYVMPTVYPR